MKTSITVLVLIGAVLCDYRGWYDHERRGGPERWGGGKGGRHEGRGRPLPPYLPPYLRNVTADAVRKYFGIISDTNLTLAEQKEKILAWGKENGILAQVEEFNRNMSNLRTDILKNVTEFISKLSNFSQKFSEVMENENQTAAHLREAIVKLRGEDPQLYAVLKFTIRQFMPKHGRCGSRGRGIWGKRGGPNRFGRPGGLRERGLGGGVEFGGQGARGRGRFGGSEGERDLGGPRGFSRQGEFGGRGFERYGVNGDSSGFGGFGGPKRGNGFGQTRGETNFGGPRRYRRQGGFGARGGFGDRGGFGGRGRFEGYGVTGDPSVSGEFGGPRGKDGFGQPGSERDFRGPRGFRKRGRFGGRRGSEGHEVREDPCEFGGFGGPAGEDGFGQPGGERDFREPRGSRKQGRFGGFGRPGAIQRGDGDSVRMFGFGQESTFEPIQQESQENTIDAKRGR